MKNLVFNKALVLVFSLLIFFFIFSGCTDQRETEEKTVQKIYSSFLTQEVKNKSVQKQIHLRGKANPRKKKVTIVSEVQGKVLTPQKPLKEGVYFNRGELLLQVDNTDSKLNLYASKSRFIAAINKVMSTIKLDYPTEYEKWAEYLDNYKIEDELKKLPEVQITELRNYLTVNGIFDMYYSVKGLENQLSKYDVIVPFNGVITKAYIQAGEMLSPNKLIAELNSTDEFEVETSVSLKDLKYLNVGKKIKLYNRDLNKHYQGKIKRINRKLDNNTQMATVYLSLKNSSLMEGMFLEGNIETEIEQKGVPISRKLLKRNNEVYVIRDSIVSLVKVDVLINSDNEVYVSGLMDYDLLINEIVSTPINGIKAVSKN
ncbi:Cation efflux system protein CzcB [Salinivirga cyanobacteriivorans]|uniref:Cation efflux system protein CzcB n=1 Tax=Salinivirga cyanobacteriivorans TaxID=1307839 RepID=A0A0S2HVL7_9BACT|nr:HlyD family efflux transporter periplasmic adaptor subunit [Salinivirga cyanobacteriivorans]ALO14093.1 Cation efflux system protein CzcB [Salinivirga cyanobacteriivorans]